MNSILVPAIMVPEFAARVKIEPRTIPIQGVQQDANTIPKPTDPMKLVVFFGGLATFFSESKARIVMMPDICSPNRIMIMPPICWMAFPYWEKAAPISVVEAPSKIKMTVIPKIKPMLREKISHRSA
ncbi:hypothetical protein GCM10008935_19030 [Alkalibacillus silvisoli]|uniref:Uncharacterized protein n=1 Tax=Alkalibacillus silvisoli TaxID=392823 RepID=A0ABN0ZYX5_9BACI